MFQNYVLLFFATKMVAFDIFFLHSDVLIVIAKRNMLLLSNTNLYSIN